MSRQSVAGSRSIDVLLEEYRVIRSDIQRFDAIVNSLITLAPTAVLFLLGYAIDHKLWFIPLAGPLILAVSGAYVYAYAALEVRTAAYAIVFLESVLPDLNWDSRRLCLERRFDLPQELIPRIAILLNALLAAACIATAWNLNLATPAPTSWPLDRNSLLIGTFAVVLVAVAALAAWKTRGQASTAMLGKYVLQWESVRKAPCELLTSQSDRDQIPSIAPEDYDVDSTPERDAAGRSE